MVHSETDKINYKIKLNSNIRPIYVEKESDLFGNIFLYANLIKKAVEIHCVDSSFIHLVGRELIQVLSCITIQIEIQILS